MLQVDKNDTNSSTGLNEDGTGDGEGGDGRETDADGLDRLTVDGGVEGRDLPKRKPGARCILEFSLAKVLADKAATRIRKIRSRKLRKWQRRLNGPDPDQVGSEEDFEAAGSYGEAEEEEEDAELDKHKRGPKVMVSLWPMGKTRWNKANCIPLTMRMEGGEEEEEVDIDAEGVQGGSEGGESPQDGSTESKNEACEVGVRDENGNEERMISGLNDDGSDDVDTGDMLSTNRHDQHVRQSIVFMNLVRDFMEERLIRSHRRSRELSEDRAEIAGSLEEYNRTRRGSGRKGSVRGVAVQCDDMWARITDEELIAIMIVRNTVTKAVALEKELVAPEGAIHEAARNIADELLAKIDDNIKADDDQRMFRIRFETPLNVKTDPTVVNLRLEYLVDEESEGKTDVKPEVVRQKRFSLAAPWDVHRTSVVDSSESPLEVAREMQTFEPLPPIGSTQDSEEIGLINPATACSSDIICKYYFGYS